MSLSDVHCVLSRLNIAFQENKHVEAEEGKEEEDSATLNRPTQRAEWCNYNFLQERGRCAVEETATGNWVSHYCCSSVVQSVRGRRPITTSQQGRPAARTMLNFFEQPCELLFLLSDASKCTEGRVV